MGIALALGAFFIALWFGAMKVCWWWFERVKGGWKVLPVVALLTLVFAPAIMS